MAGRAARNAEGLVIFYADKITESMQRTLDETQRRREKQLRYNEEHGIIPRTIRKSTEQIFIQTSVLDIKGYDGQHKYALSDALPAMAAEEPAEYKSVAELDKQIALTRKRMEQAAKDLDFMEAARLRDNMLLLQQERGKMK